MGENKSRNGNDPLFSNNEVSGKISGCVTESHPLMNVLVLDNIISHLNYKDVKNLRLVCHRWNEVAETVFWKLSRVKIKVVKENPRWHLLEKVLEEHGLELAEKSQKLTESFESTFPSPAGLPTDTIKFEGFINRRDLEYFWKERGSLTLTSVYFLLFCEPSKESIDLNGYITPKLTTLNIGVSQQKCFTVSLKKLSNIQNLKLYYCEILLDGKIVPRELDLKLCSVIYEGKLFKPGFYTNSHQKILINDFVDFSKIKKLILEGNFWKLDFGSDTILLEHLALKEVEIIGLPNSQWKTNFLDAQHYIYIGDRMEIKTIRGLDIADHVGIGVLESLPKTLEHLHQRFDIFGTCSALLPPLMCAYPMLKSLAIRISGNRDFRILDFSNCTSLVDFQLISTPDVYQMDFNRIILPNSIKNMKLQSVIPNIDVPWQLDTLVLHEYPFSSIENVLQGFSTTRLVIEFVSDLVREEDQMFIVNQWRNSSIEQLAFGRIDLSSSNANLNSEFIKSVDKIGRYFLFTNKSSDGKGEAIYCKEFERLSTLNVHKELNALLF